MLKVLDLFSGIGGFSLGLERTGEFKTVGFCEIDPFCRKVLAKHWPGVWIHDDIRTLSAQLVRERCGSVDVICGGYPCQPFSHAGKRRGTEDDRHLWPEMYRLVGELGPDAVLAENVAGHISMGLDQVLFDLEALSYSARAVVIPAAGVDAPHIRQRVWIVACNSDIDCQPTVSVNDEMARVSLHAPDANGSRLSQRQGNAGVDSKEECGHQRQDASVCFRWPNRPGNSGVDDGIPNRVDRLRAIGNAVVPQVVEVIGRAILESMKCV